MLRAVHRLAEDVEATAGSVVVRAESAIATETEINKVEKID
jgi:hypothetical protein